jgi:hypothetical protein
VQHAGNSHLLTNLTAEMITKIQQAQSMRIQAADKIVKMVPLNLYSDDTSGNRSKKWNKHESWLLSLSGLPFNETQSLYHVRFISTSNIAGALEQAEGVVQSIVDDLEKGVVAYDASMGAEVLIFGGVFCFQGDNPMQSLMCSHVGMNGNLFCCICTIADNLESTDGLASYFQVSQVFIFVEHI